jgi:hypothetical protein
MLEETGILGGVPRRQPDVVNDRIIIPVTPHQATPTRSCYELKGNTVAFGS